MKILHILKTEQDQKTQKLIDIISRGEESTVFTLYDEAPDYEGLVDQIFDHEKTITWW